MPSSTDDKSTQTDQESDFSTKQKKVEKAIVMPTQRDVEKQPEDDDTDNETVFSEAEIVIPRPQRRSLGSISTMNQDAGTNSVSLYYVNELARKEIELGETRLSAREFECALRELKWKYNVDTFK